MKVCVGGTFDVLHVGHKALFKKAFDVAGHDGYVAIGVSGEAMASHSRDRKVSCLHCRIERLRMYLAGEGLIDRADIVEISDPFGPAAQGDFDAIVVSPETAVNAELLNDARAGAGLEPLSIIRIPFSMAEDGMPISSTRVVAGEIDAAGKRMRPIEVAVGSENPVKVNAAGAVFKKAFPTADVSVFGVSVQSGVPEQPLEADVAHGARNRALAAIGARGSDYGVGIEAGIIFEPHMNEHIDVQYCCVIDKTGHATWGIGPGFCYPPEVLRQVNDGRTVGEAMSDISQENRIGSRGGAIGYLSKGLMDRIALTEQAVTMALIPRIRSELYSAAPKRRATC